MGRIQRGPDLADPVELQDRLDFLGAPRRLDEDEP
jgi:hypothetical protein